MAHQWLIPLMGGLMLGVVIAPFRHVLERWAIKKLAITNDGTSERDARLKHQASAIGHTHWMITYRTTSDTLVKLEVPLEKTWFHGDEIVTEAYGQILVIDRRSSLISVASTLGGKYS